MRKRKIQSHTCDNNESSSDNAMNQLVYDVQNENDKNVTKESQSENFSVQNQHDNSKTNGADANQSVHKRENSTEYEKSSNPVPKKKVTEKTRAKTEKRPPHHIRYSIGNHTSERNDDRVRCKMEGCKYKSNIKCVKCNVHLCANNRNCFDDFHNIDKS